MAPVQNVELDIDNLLAKLDTTNEQLTAIKTALTTGGIATDIHAINIATSGMAIALSVFGGSMSGGLLNVSIADNAGLSADLQAIASTIGVTNERLEPLPGDLLVIANRLAPDGHHIAENIAQAASTVRDELIVIANRISPDGHQLGEPIVQAALDLKNQLIVLANRLCPDGETLVDTLAEQGGDLVGAMTSVADRICPEEETLVDTLAEQGGDLVGAITETGNRIAPEGSSLHQDAADSLTLLDNHLDGIGNRLAPAEGNIAATLATVKNAIDALKLSGDDNVFTRIQNAVTAVKDAVHADVPAAAVTIRDRMAPTGHTLYEIADRIAPAGKDIYTFFGMRLKQLRSVLAWVGLKDVTYDADQEEIESASAWMARLQGIEDAAKDLLLQESELTLIDGEGNIAQYHHYGP